MKAPAAGARTPLEEGGLDAPTRSAAPVRGGVVGRACVLLTVSIVTACAGRPGAGAESPSAAPAPAVSITVELSPRVPRAPRAPRRLNFAVPLAQGSLRDEHALRVSAQGQELPAARRGLARYPDGSWRSVQLQVEPAPGTTQLEVTLGQVGQGGVELLPVSALVDEQGLPAVWALLPAAHLAQSGLVGPMVPRAQLLGTALDAWANVCDYQRFGTEVFLEGAARREVWLFDRVTAMVRGHVFTGALAPLEAAAREVELYRAGLTLDAEGVVSALAVPGASEDLKYHYSQGLALHYLLTGDDRHREAAEAIARRAARLWDSPGYAGGDDFWTERHAGFGLLAFEWAAVVSDDEAERFSQLADAAATAYLQLQDSYPPGYADREARCFAHSATAHSEPYGHDGCSPWMSAILAEALLTYATRVGGERALLVRESLIKLGRSIARDGRDPLTGRPYYWMGVGAGRSQPDETDEHWGEAAYLVALAWRLDGKRDAGLRQQATQLIDGLRARGFAGHVRSFNWQCRTAVATPALLL
ncbi:MAG: hypothetical protein IPI49_21320 [Myxococcales bacterium]|nr:hypothetical protein [Myxococcales bacterium]